MLTTPEKNHQRNHSQLHHITILSTFVWSCNLAHGLKKYAVSWKVQGKILSGYQSPPSPCNGPQTPIIDDKDKDKDKDKKERHVGRMRESALPPLPQRASRAAHAYAANAFSLISHQGPQNRSHQTNVTPSSLQLPQSIRFVCMRALFSS